MTDLYTKVVLTVIAAALCVSVFQNMNVVNPAFVAVTKFIKSLFAIIKVVVLGVYFPMLYFRD